MALRGCIVVSCYSRPDAFRTLLRSIYAQRDSDTIHKIFYIQKSSHDLLTLIEEWEDKNRSLIVIEAESDSPLENINLNRWKSQVIAFDIMKFDWALIVEEDVELHPSAVAFVTKIMDSFFSNSRFVGCNLGSYEIEGVHGDYSILTAGLHGQASALPRSTWLKIKKRVNTKKLATYAYDWLVEPVHRDGFTITTNRSMFIDNGWFSSTHAPRNPNDIHYERLKLSYGEVSKSVSSFSPLHKNIPHSWPKTYPQKKSLYQYKFQSIKHLWEFSILRVLFHKWLKSSRFFSIRP